MTISMTQPMMLGGLLVAFFIVMWGASTLGNKHRLEYGAHPKTGMLIIGFVIVLIALIMTWGHIPINVLTPHFTPSN